MNQSLYQFEATRFAGNSPWQQWRRLFGQMIRVALVLLSGDIQRTAAAVWTVKQSCEDMHLILSGMGVDVELGRSMSICDSLEAGDYNPEDPA